MQTLPTLGISKYLLRHCHLCVRRKNSSIVFCLLFCESFHDVHVRIKQPQGRYTVLDASPACVHITISTSLHSQFKAYAKQITIAPKSDVASPTCRATAFQTTPTSHQVQNLRKPDHHRSKERRGESDLPGDCIPNDINIPPSPLVSPVIKIACDSKTENAQY